MNRDWERTPVHVIRMRQTNYSTILKSWILKLNEYDCRKSMKIAWSTICWKLSCMTFSSIFNVLIFFLQKCLVTPGANFLWRCIFFYWDKKPQIKRRSGKLLRDSAPVCEVTMTSLASPAHCWFVSACARIVAKFWVKIEKNKIVQNQEENTWIFFVFIFLPLLENDVKYREKQIKTDI